MAKDKKIFISGYESIPREDREFFRKFLMENPDQIFTKSRHPVYPGLHLEVLCAGDYVFIHSEHDRQWYPRTEPHDGQFRFSAAICGEPHFKLRKSNHTRLHQGPYRSTNFVAAHKGTIDYCDYDPDLRIGRPWLFIPLRIEIPGEKPVEYEFAFRQPACGRVVASNTSLKIETTIGLLTYIHEIFPSRWETFKFALSKHVNPNGHNLWRCFFTSAIRAAFKEKDIAFTDASMRELSNFDQAGIKRLESNNDNKKMFDRLHQENLTLWLFYLWLHSGRKYEKVSANQMLASFLQECDGDYDKFKDGLSDALDAIGESPETVGDIPCPQNSYGKSSLNLDSWPLVQMLPSAKSKLRRVKAQNEWYLRNSLSDKADGLGITEKDYPLLWAGVINGDIPLNIFHEPKSENSLVNTEFDLWEESLAQPGWSPILFSITKDASRRSTYTHLVTSYLIFLHQLKGYLQKHTNKDWTILPKFVESEWQLEMEKTSGEETVKRRGALTPIVDNVRCVVEVPYASLSLTGRQTTYCYSDRYYLFERGFNDPEGGGVVTKDLVEKLNGRDDYGLMFYTLTGSRSNRGYPTFLIIFERLAETTRVHFHRTHPSRFKNGRKTPTSELIRECYRYMAGNVYAKDIYAQQGDLIFIRSNPQGENPKDFPALENFEGHGFVPSAPEANDSNFVRLVENKSKTIKNRLGHIFVPDGCRMQHEEHAEVVLESGWFEIRRTKSWGANPKAVWSLIID